MKYITLLLLMFMASACKLDKSYEGFEVRQYIAENGSAAAANAGQVNFSLETLGALNLRSLLNVNIFPIKIYGTAALMMEPGADLKKLNGNDLPIVMQKFGFLRPEKIANWNNELSPEPKIKGNLGFVHSQVNQKILGKNVSLEVATLNCAACHSSLTYDSSGNPKNEAWLGAGNTSLNIDGFLNQIYFGLKKGMQNPEQFMSKIKEAFPEMSLDEENTIRKYIFPKLVSALKDYKEMDRVLPFPNGGPGHTNGIAAFKRGAGILKHPFKYHAEEAGFVAIPNIMNRGFRSSLAIDGAYGILGQERFLEISKDEANNPDHLDRLSELAAFFTYSAMGNSINNIEPNIPKVKEIFNLFIKETKPHNYPGMINAKKALRGETIFKHSCASCHGTYSSGIENVELLSFPNKHIPQNEMGTDPYRWRTVDKKIVDFAEKNVFSKYIDAGYQLGGYTAPVLSGLWFKAPYLHNGSIPTLWQFMNPSLRPARFMMGGHALDLEQVGIKGKLSANGIYEYSENYKPFSTPAVFDTSENGKSNLGHEKEFVQLSAEDKWDLIEYLKLL